MSTQMDEPTRQLFGDFPRSVGSPHQFIVHSESEFGSFLSAVQGRRNAYASISWFPDEEVVCDKVSFDLDSSGKEAEFPDDMRDDTKIDMMRGDPDLADRVLGKVCEETRELATAAMDDGFPVIGVFSGFGMHIHLLTKPTLNPSDKLASTARYYRDVLKLATPDHQVIGDAQRILRIPNMRRVHVEDERSTNPTLYKCDLYCVPLTGDELARITTEELLELSKEPRPSVSVEADERPAMPLYEDYTEPDRDSPEFGGTNGFDEDIPDEGVEWLLKQMLQMPCMYETLILDPEPPHPVRVNSAVLLFNLGKTPDEVVQLFSRLGWDDWDRDYTLEQLNQIYRKGYADMTCSTIRDEGLCVREEEPTECKTYNWSGGECEWR